MTLLGYSAIANAAILNTFLRRFKYSVISKKPLQASHTLSLCVCRCECYTHTNLIRHTGKTPVPFCCTPMPPSKFISFSLCSDKLERAADKEKATERSSSDNNEPTNMRE